MQFNESVLETLIHGVNGCSKGCSEGILTPTSSIDFIPHFTPSPSQQPHISPLLIVHPSPGSLDPSPTPCARQPLSPLRELPAALTQRFFRLAIAGIPKQ